MRLRSARRLIRLGRLDEAETVLAEALSRAPRCGTLLEQYAICAHNGGRYAEAVTRWQAFVSVVPDSAFGRAAIAANLRELHRLEEAEVTIAAALAVHPDDIHVLAEAGRIADRRQKAEEALSIWQRLLVTPHAPAEWRQSRDRDLVILGRTDEAETAIAGSRMRDPHYHGHLANLAMLRLAQGRWNDAAKTASELRVQHPSDAAALDLLGQALQGAAFAAAEASGGLRMPVQIERVEDEATRNLMLGFESLWAKIASSASCSAATAPSRSGCCVGTG